MTFRTSDNKRYFLFNINSTYYIFIKYYSKTHFCKIDYSNYRYDFRTILPIYKLLYFNYLREKYVN